MPDWGKMAFREFPPKPWADLLPKASEEGRDLVSKLVRFQSKERLSAAKVIYSTHSLFLLPLLIMVGHGASIFLHMRLCCRMLGLLLWRRTLRLNLLGPFHTVKPTDPILDEQFPPRLQLRLMQSEVVHCADS